MPRSAKIVRGHRYQVGRFAGSWYVADLDQNRFVYGPFLRRETAEARLQKIVHMSRVRNPEWKPPFAKRKRKRLGVLYQKAFAKFSKENPRRRGVLIYGRVLKIFAQKTEGPYKGQQFVHTFKPGAIMMGLPDGSIKISHP